MRNCGYKKEGREGGRRESGDEMHIPQQGRDTVCMCVSALGSDLI